MFNVRPHEVKTLSWWHSRKDQIDFNPVYQRKSGIWSRYDQGFLIDSIVNDYDIPKIYLADFSYGNNALNPGKYLYAVIDGKQRFEAIFDFYENQLPLNRDFVYHKDPNLQLAGYYFKDLRKNFPEIASDFENFNMAVMSVYADDEAKIDDLFVRLNRSKGLTGAEIRSALGGPVPLLIEKLVQHPFFTEKIKFSTKRKNEYNVAAKLLLVEDSGKLTNTKKANLDRFTREKRSSTEPDLMHIYDSAVETLNRMAEVFVDSDPLLSTAGIVVLYYWLVRNSEPEVDRHIRPFLLEFNQMRREDSHLSSEQSSQLADFNVSARSINDAVSLENAYRILEDYFRKFCARSLKKGVS